MRQPNECVSGSAPRMTSSLPSPTVRATLRVCATSEPCETAAALAMPVVPEVNRICATRVVGDERPRQLAITTRRLHRRLRPRRHRHRPHELGHQRIVDDESRLRQRRARRHFRRRRHRRQRHHRHAAQRRAQPHRHELARVAGHERHAIAGRHAARRQPRRRPPSPLRRLREAPRAAGLVDEERAPAPLRHRRRQQAGDGHGSRRPTSSSTSAISPSPDRSMAMSRSLAIPVSRQRRT